MVLVGDVHFRIAARDCRIYGRHNAIQIELDVRPLLVPENNDGDLSPRKDSADT